MCRVANHQTRLPRATSSLTLNASRDGALLDPLLWPLNGQWKSCCYMAKSQLCVWGAAEDSNFFTGRLWEKVQTASSVMIRNATWWHCYTVKTVAFQNKFVKAVFKPKLLITFPACRKQQQQEKKTPNQQYTNLEFANSCVNNELCFSHPVVHPPHLYVMTMTSLPCWTRSHTNC